MTKRNITLDILKIIAAIGVVFIHTPLEPNLLMSDKTGMVSYAMRFAVPFFIVSGGYFYRGKNLNPVYSILKLYMALIVLRFIFNLVFFEQFEGAIRYSTYWYFTTYAMILLLTKNQGRKWLSFLFILSITWNLLTGHIIRDFAPLVDMDFYSGMHIGHDNVLTYLSLFIAGIWMRKLPIDKVGKPISVGILIGCGLLIVGNGLFFSFPQAHIFNFGLAIALLIAGLNLPIYSDLPLRNIYMDLFVYQILVLPVVGLGVRFFTESTSFGIYVLVGLLSCVGCVVLATFIRFIDRKVLDNAIYGL